MHGRLAFYIATSLCLLYTYKFIHRSQTKALPLPKALAFNSLKYPEVSLGFAGFILHFASILYERISFLCHQKSLYTTMAEPSTLVKTICSVCIILKSHTRCWDRNNVNFPTTAHLSLPIMLPLGKNSYFCKQNQLNVLL